MSEAKHGWDINNDQDLVEITKDVTEVMNKNGCAFPYGWSGKVKSLKVFPDGHALVFVDGAYASGKKASLRYRININYERRYWTVESFIELGEEACAVDCMKDCILLNRYQWIHVFEETVRRNQLSPLGCESGAHVKIVNIRSIVTDFEADVYFSYYDEDEKTEKCCHYHLHQDEYDCWRVTDWRPC